MPLAWRLGTHTRKRPEIQTRRSGVWITINQRPPGQGRRRAGGGHARRWQLRALGRQRDRRVVGSTFAASRDTLLPPCPGAAAPSPTAKTRTASLVARGQGCHQALTRKQIACSLRLPMIEGTHNPAAKLIIRLKRPKPLGRGATKQSSQQCVSRNLITVCLVGEPRERSGADPLPRLFG
jgi:hypothetical protein